MSAGESANIVETFSLSATADIGRRARAGQDGTRKDATNSVPATVTPNSSRI
jgi:hypothetical protein